MADGQAKDPNNHAKWFRFEIQHIFASEVFDEFADLLRDAGIKEEMRGNKIALLSDTTVVNLVQAAGSAIQSMLFAAGWGINRHDSRAPGGNHPGYNAFLSDQLETIKNLGLSRENQNRAVQHLFKFATQVSQGKISVDGNVVAIMGGDGQKSVLKAAWDSYKFADYGNLNTAEKISIDVFFGSTDKSLVDANSSDNTDFRNEKAHSLKDSGLFTTEQIKLAGFGLEGANKAKATTSASIGMIYNLVAKLGYKLDDPDKSGEATAAALDRVLGGSLSFETIKQQAVLIFNYMGANAGSFLNSLSNLGPFVVDSIKQSAGKMVASAASHVSIGDIAEFINAAYDHIKIGAKTGDWSLFYGDIVKYGAGMIQSLLLVTGSTMAAFKIHPIAGAVVAAGWAAYGIVDSYTNAGELLGKIVVDLKDKVQVASDTLLKLTDGLSDIMLAYYGVGKEIPFNIDPFNKLYVVDDLDPTKPAHLIGSNDNELIFARHGSVIYAGGGDDEIHHNGYGAVYAGDGNDQILVYDTTAGFRAYGGAGNDYLLAKNGVGGEFYGGPGRDWFFVKTPGAKLYGDTVDGQAAAGSGGSDSDNFWWTPGTTIMDAGKTDVMKFFGVPLVGGTNDIPLVAKGLLGFFGGTTGLGLASNPLYFDNLLPFINYIFVGKDMYVANVFDGLLNLFTSVSFDKMGDGSSIRGGMKVKNFDRVETAWGILLPFLEPGSLGMKFKTANPYLAALALLPPILGGVNRLLGMVDDVIALAEFTGRFVKSLAWVAGADPLILDLDGDGIETIAMDESGVRFDQNSDFFSERSGWLSGDDGFLVLDENANGKIEDASEMFGGVGISGLAELATHDSNHDGKITVADIVWADLKFWRDIDGDAITDDGELFTLDALGISEIGLTATPVNSTTPQGTRLLDKAYFSFVSGGIGKLYDAVFETNNVDTVFRGESGTASWLADTHVDARGFGTVVDMAVAMSNDIHFGEVVRASSDAMTVPKLKVLREQAGEALGLWGETLELTRELTPVRVQTIAGKVTLADYGVYHEDASGGFWTLHSGTAILDGQGAVIARASLEDVLSQAGFQLEQSFSPSTRGTAVQFRDEVPYLTKIVNGRAVILDHGVKQADGAGGYYWQLASGAVVTDALGTVIAAPTLANILASPHAAGTEWRVEEIGFNPYANVAVEAIGVKFVDGKVVDYTVEVTDGQGSFYVWARNLDYAAELQFYYGSARDFNLRNYAVDFDTLDEVGSTDDSHLRVELLTPGQFHLATSLGGVNFQPAMLSATYDNVTGQLHYSVNSTGNISLGAANQDYVSGVKVMIDFIAAIMDEYVTVSRAFAVRMAMQGGLKEFAAGIHYDVTTDKYVPTQDRELAPMFEAIFAHAPQGYDAAQAYLKDWNEILWQIYPDYKPDGSRNQYGATVAIDQPFIMQMMLAAWENVPSSVDLPTAMDAFGVNEELLRTLAPNETSIEGTRKTDYFYLGAGGLGNQLYGGAMGTDFYFVGKNFGKDFIYDFDDGAKDELRFSHLKPADVEAIREGQDLILKVKGSTDELRIIDQFLGELNPYLSNGKQADTGVNSIVFANGVIWDRFRMAFEVARPADAWESVIGSGATDVLWGGKGNDVLHGGLGGDIYVYARGDGQDLFSEAGGGAAFGPIKAGIDFIQFRGDITADDLVLTRNGAGDDLFIGIKDKQGNLTTDKITIEDQFLGFALNFGAFASFLPGFDNGYVSPNTIERFIFEDGTSLDSEEIIKRVLENAKTTGDDAIYGLNNANSLDGGAGNDLLTGLSGADTYIFGRGYGHDVIRDEDFAPKLFGDTPDFLQFKDDIRWSDLDFLRVGKTDNLTLQIKGTNDKVTLVDYLLFVPFGPLFINLIETVTFGDGTTWSWLKLLQHYVNISETSGNDTVYGFEIVSDLMDGGAGNDWLEGQGGNDIYVFSRGYGTDTILDADGTERLQLRGIHSEDVTFSRTALDLIITVDDTGDRIILKNQYVRAGQQGQATEYFEFSDRTYLFTDFNPEDIDLIGTAADETITGSDFAETIDGKGGDDTLIGRDGGDRYKFDVGYGNDVIIDVRAKAGWQDRKGTVVPVNDVVVFGDDITQGNVAFARDGNDLVVYVNSPGRQDTLRIKDQFLDTLNGVERFEFKNGTYLTMIQVEQIAGIVGSNRGDNRIVGSLEQSNSFDGRQGDDVMLGGNKADTYAFTTGYDFDRIEEKTDVAGVIDKVVFGSTVRQQDLVVRRSGDDLQIDLGGGVDVLTIVNGITTSRIEEFHFADLTVLTIDQLLGRLLVGTDNDDQLLGFNGRNDVLDGGKGSDSMSGGTGNDTFRFGIGDGQDSITDSAGIDRLEFKNVTRDQVEFSSVKNDLLVTLRNTGERVVLFANAGTDTSRFIENFVFADGVTLTHAEVVAIVRDQLSNTAQDTFDAATLDLTRDIAAGAGFDTVALTANAKMVFASGDGIDTVHLSGWSATGNYGEINFSNFSSTDVRVRVAGLDSKDIILAFPSTGDQVILKNGLLSEYIPTLEFADGIS